jgi:hypothetical protein
MPAPILFDFSLLPRLFSIAKLEVAIEQLKKKTTLVKGLAETAKKCGAFGAETHALHTFAVAGADLTVSTSGQRRN